jgi:cytochrome c biogenesis factor
VITSLKTTMVRFPIATWALVGMSAFVIKAGAISSFHRKYYTQHEMERKKELITL